MLGVGTSVFGTIDRKKAPAAGMKGFELKKAVSNPSQQAKVEQLPWKLQQLPEGRWGVHFGILFYRFNKKYVAPHLIH